MPELIMYMTADDTPPLLEWLNKEPVAWITCENRDGLRYRWKAIDEIDSLPAGSYCLWHPETSPLVIPSGQLGIDPVAVLDPFAGWEQTLDSENYQTPWFGPDHPGIFALFVRFQGRGDEDALARSGFCWIGNYFRTIGRPAPPVAARWWQRLRRFVKGQSVGIPWPPDQSSGKVGAYAFPKAYTDYREGRVLDANP